MMRSIVFYCETDSLNSWRALRWLLFVAMHITTALSHLINLQHLKKNLGKRSFVCRYNEGGFVQSYPDLREPRTAHACASFGNEASHFDLMFVNIARSVIFFRSLFVEKNQTWISVSCLFILQQLMISWWLVCSKSKQRLTTFFSLSNYLRAQMSNNI